MGRIRDQVRADELLSAYLDGALTPRERERLEVRLAVDAELRARLESLRRTVALLRDMPRVPAPRNFLLSPAMVAPAQRRPQARTLLAPALSFATTLSALLCVLVFVANVMGGLPGAGRVAAPPPQEVPLPGALAEATPQALESALSAEEVPSPAPEPRSLPVIPSPTPSVNLMMAAEAVAVTETLTEGMPYLGVASTATLCVPDAGACLTATAAYTAPPAVAEERSAEPPAVSEMPEGRRLSTLLLPWLIPAGLGLLTVGLAGASFLAWRARRR